MDREAVRLVVNVYAGPSPETCRKVLPGEKGDGERIVWVILDLLLHKKRP